MKIGIIGYGIVGKAVGQSLEKIGNVIVPHDITMNTNIEDTLETDICFLCVPTPSNEIGECDTSIVESVVKDLNSINYKGLICIKSTVTPGTTDNLARKYPDLDLAFVPEFLRERCAEKDFQENHDVCVVGCLKEEHFKLIKESHGKYPRNFIMVTPAEAEISKYFNNIYNVTHIILANSFYEVCNHLGANYENVKNAVLLRDHISDNYIDCKEDLRGFGGVCLPKDTAAMDKFCEKSNLNVDFFKSLLSENKKYKTTVFKGMRSKQNQ